MNALHEMKMLPFTQCQGGKRFQINSALVLGFRAIGQGHAGASKMLSFLGLKPIKKAYWSENRKKRVRSEENAGKGLNRAAFEVKKFKFSLALVNGTQE